jgi:hypothetical protein
MIAFNTSDPAALLKALDGAIARGNHAGGITTWQKIGSDYTHAATQWHKKAYFEPHVQPGKLVFNIVKNKGTDISVLVYGYYHGHLLETFLNHFDKMFTAASCSPLCDVGDICSAAA